MPNEGQAWMEFLGRMRSGPLIIEKIQKEHLEGMVTVEHQRDMNIF